MKKHILLAGFGLGLCFMSFSQVSIALEGTTTDLSGTTHTQAAVGVTDQTIDFSVTNLGASDNFNITRLRIDVPATGWADYLCWGASGTIGACYGASQMSTNPWITPTAVTLASGQSGLLAVHVDPDDVVGGTAHYRYYVGRTINAPVDSVDLIVTSAAGIKIVKSSPSFSVYPNPADDYLNVTISGNDATIKISSVLGNVVLEEKINGTKKINTSELTNGVYILSYNSNGNTYTKRFVVKH